MICKCAGDWIFAKVGYLIYSLCIYALELPVYELLYTRYIYSPTRVQSIAFSIYSLPRFAMRARALTCALAVFRCMHQRCYTTQTHHIHTVYRHSRCFLGGSPYTDHSDYIYASLCICSARAVFASHMYMSSKGKCGLRSRQYDPANCLISW